MENVYYRKLSFTFASLFDLEMSCSLKVKWKSTLSYRERLLYCIVTEYWEGLSWWRGLGKVVRMVCKGDIVKVTWSQSYVIRIWKGITSG